jgi:hypothetical protein
MKGSDGKFSLPFRIVKPTSHTGPSPPPFALTRRCIVAILIVDIHGAGCKDEDGYEWALTVHFCT